jgi:hypothetical protein
MRYYPVLICLFLAFPASSQPNKTIPRENIIKINLGSLAVKNIALQYEWVVGKKTSAALGLRFQPYGKVPFQSWIKDQVNDPDIQVGLMQIGNFALTPEFRFYLGKSAAKGLYIAPYVRYATYQMEAPVEYQGVTSVYTAFFNGHIRSFSGGILFGNQFSLGENLVLDLWILGGHFGTSNGQLDFTATLTPSEQDDLRSTLDEVDIPLFNIEHSIHANGGTIRSKGAWLGFRGFVVNLGWRF